MSLIKIKTLSIRLLNQKNPRIKKNNGCLTEKGPHLVCVSHVDVGPVV
jgi:hypothetical protein